MDTLFFILEVFMSVLYFAGFIIVVLSIIFYAPLKVIEMIVWLIPLPGRDARANNVFDFLCDIMYPWNWGNLPRRWRNHKNRRRNPHMKRVKLYADGACSGNPGPGGWGVILMLGEHQKELSGGEADTTNNRMELTAVIKGLEALKEPCIVELYSDSKYIIDGLEKGWAEGWRAHGWVKPDKKPAQNPDLWGRLLELCEQHTVNLHWVKGHADNTYNNRCDRMAVSEWMKLK